MKHSDILLIKEEIFCIHINLLKVKSVFIAFSVLFVGVKVIINALFYLHYQCLLIFFLLLPLFYRFKK